MFSTLTAPDHFAFMDGQKKLRDTRGIGLREARTEFDFLATLEEVLCGRWQCSSLVETSQE